MIIFALLARSSWQREAPPLLSLSGETPPSVSIDAHVPALLTACSYICLPGGLGSPLSLLSAAVPLPAATSSPIRRSELTAVAHSDPESPPINQAVSYRRATQSSDTPPGFLARRSHSTPPTPPLRFTKKTPSVCSR